MRADREKTELLPVKESRTTSLRQAEALSNSPNNRCDRQFDRKIDTFAKTFSYGYISETFARYQKFPASALLFT